MPPEPPVHRPPRPSAPRRPERCLNCDAPLTDRFCAACGQDNRATRLRVREVYRHLADEVFDFELPLLRTFVGLTLRPGHVCLDYIRGRRKRYSNPLRYLLIMAALFIVVFLLSDIRPGNLGMPGTSGLTAEQQERLNEYAAELSRFVVGSYTYLVLLSVPAVAGMLRFLFLRDRRNFAEHLVFVMFIEAQRLFLTAILTPFGFLDRPLPRLALEVILLAYFVWAAMVFFEGGRVRRGILAAIGAIGARVLVMALVAVVLLGFKVIPDVVSGRYPSIVIPPAAAPEENASPPGGRPTAPEPP